MTKDVLVRISGMQFIGEEEDQGPVEIITAGNYYEKNGRRFIRYDEVLEGTENVVRSLIKLDEHSMEVIKKGAANVHMVFEENKKTLSCYETPFGNLFIGISAAHVEILPQENQLDVKVDYALEINDEFLADCSIIINVQSKTSGI